MGSKPSSVCFLYKAVTVEAIPFLSDAIDVNDIVGLPNCYLG